jgi:hypothetical protein
MKQVIVSAATFALAALPVACAGGHMATPPVSDRVGDLPVGDRAALTISGPSGHLYVADAAGVQRFDINNGIPASTADLTYSGVYAPIALDSLHYLYAASGTGIKIYLPGSTQLSRAIPIAALVCTGGGLGSLSGYIKSENQVFSLALDKNRYLFAGVYSKSFTFRTASAGGFWIVVGSIAIRVFAPGSSTPIDSIVESTFSYTTENTPFCKLPSHTAFDGLATDSSDELFVSNEGATPVIDVETGIETTSPKQVRSIAGTGVTNPNGLAVDASGNLYVDNEKSTSSFVAVYPVTANGDPVPLRTISIKGALSFGSGIDVVSGRLFVTDPSGNAVYEVPATASGIQTPTILHVTQPTDVKFGP